MSELSAPAVLALDVSLTSTGIALPDGVCSRLRPTVRGTDRLEWVRDAVLDLADNWSPDLVAIEGYSYGSKISQAHSQGELGGVLRLALKEAGHRWLAVPPATIKKYACGAGNASKDQVLIAAVRRLDYPGDSHDEADAAWLRALILDAAGHPFVEVPKGHRGAITATTAARPVSVRDQVAALLDHPRTETA